MNERPKSSSGRGASGRIPFKVNYHKVCYLPDDCRYDNKDGFLTRHSINIGTMVKKKKVKKRPSKKPEKVELIVPEKPSPPPVNPPKVI